MLNKRSRKMCPYCGGMHPAGQCPVFMMPPMTSPMMPPMTSPMMPPMMPPMTSPMMPPTEGGINDSHGVEMMMPGMMDVMEHHTRLLEHIACRVDEIYDIVVSMHMGGAKG